MADHNDRDEVTGERTPAFSPAEVLNRPDAAAAAGADSAGLSTEGLPAGSAALLVVKRGPNTGSRFVLDRPVTSAGRHPDCDVFLDDITVSRRHAELGWENDELRVVDVGSLNGTYVNREPVESAAVLASGDQVQIGKFRLVVVKSYKRRGRRR